LLLALTWTALKWTEDDPIGISHNGSKLVDWDHRREEVKNAFIGSWDAYARHAWGELRENLNL
jgi:mannosyl-oligosaccharide alpha-1,2-mannosidase